MKATIFLEDGPDGTVALHAMFFGGDNPRSPAHQAAKELIAYCNTLGKQLTEPAQRLITVPPGENPDVVLAAQPPLIGPWEGWDSVTK